MGKNLSKQFLYFVILLWVLYGKIAYGETNYNLVFIHIGKSIPSYVETAINQARNFNPDCQIILIANNEALKKLNSNLRSKNVVYTPCESLPMTPQHLAFRKTTNWANGFWRFTCERFLYLHDLMEYLNLECVFHLENDNMLYVNLGSLLPIFQTYYPGIAATFDNDQRCIPGFIFVSNKNVMRRLADFFSKLARKSYTDMQTIALFKDANGSEVIDYLPIIPETYPETHPLISESGHTVEKKERFFNHIELFCSIFDAAAIGQYLGGIDANMHGVSNPGFINESSIFNPSFFDYEWIKDPEGRKVPFAVFGNKKYRINNIHVHSKNLDLFAS